jgi:hypothetical protein
LGGGSTLPRASSVASSSSAVSSSVKSRVLFWRTGTRKTDEVPFSLRRHRATPRLLGSYGNSFSDSWLLMTSSICLGLTTRICSHEPGKCLWLPVTR